MSTKNKLQLTPEDKARALQVRADKLTSARIRRYWEIFEDAGSEVEKQTVRGVNALREVGEGLKTLARHEQITAEFFETVKWSLPKTLDYRKARCAVHIANRVEEPVKTALEAFAVQRELFAAMTDAKEPHRQIAQNGHDRNFWNELVNESASFSSLFAKLEEEKPMDRWGRDELSKFVESTKPIVDKHNTAVEMLTGI